MNTKIIVQPDNFQTLAICAFRYAFNRKTYIVDDMVNLLKQHKKDLDANTIHVICRDIEREVAKFEDLNSFFSHDDLKQWIKLSEVLRGL
jgi:hypothetical protein